MNKLRILWVSPTLPIPVNAGNRRHLNYLINDAQKHGAVIDFVLYGWEVEAENWRRELESMFNRYLNIPQPTTKTMSFGDYWGIDDWVSDELLSAIVDFANRQAYDAVFVEYVWLSKVLQLFDHSVVKVIDTHDIFTNRDSLLQSQGIEKQWYYTRETEESIGLARADIVLGITSTDCDFFRKVLLKKNAATKVLPCGSGIATRRAALSKAENTKREICFGYLASSNSMNKESAQRFFSTLNDYNIKESGFYFNIGGGISSYIGEYENVKIFKKGYVKDPESFYGDIDVVIAPMVEGTGLKIKTIEAIEYHKPFMATKQATNDIPVSSIWHNFATIEVFAKYLATWMLSADKIKLSTTIGYLSAETARIHKEIVARQTNYEDTFWNTLRVEVSYKAKYKKTGASLHNIKNASCSERSSRIYSRHLTKAPAVSVIIAAFNTENYIARCLDSIILDNLFDKVEVFVIDDGSTDKTPEVVSRYVNDYKNIKLIRQPNSGQGVARNKGIDAATGEYLYFVDSDDYLGANALSVMYEAAMRGDIDICSPDRPYLSERPIEFISALPGWCCFIKRSLLNSNGQPIRQPAIRSGQDGVFANMVLTRCKSALVCKNAKYHYEKRENSTFNSLKKDLSVVSDLVEQHLSVLRSFYSRNDLFVEQTARYLLFLQDETYKWRYKANLKDLPDFVARHIYLTIKCELVAKLNLVDERSLGYFSDDFIEISSLSYEEHQAKYGKK